MCVYLRAPKQNVIFEEKSGREKVNYEIEWEKTRVPMVLYLASRERWKTTTIVVVGKAERKRDWVVLGRKRTDAKTDVMNIHRLKLITLDQHIITIIIIVIKMDIIFQGYTLAYLTRAHAYPYVVAMVVIWIIFPIFASHTHTRISIYSSHTAQWPWKG